MCSTDLNIVQLRSNKIDFPCTIKEYDIVRVDHTLVNSWLFTADGETIDL